MPVGARSPKSGRTGVEAPPSLSRGGSRVLSTARLSSAHAGGLGAQWLGPGLLLPIAKVPNAGLARGIPAGDVGLLPPYELAPSGLCTVKAALGGPESTRGQLGFDDRSGVRLAMADACFVGDGGFRGFSRLARLSSRGGGGCSCACGGDDGSWNDVAAVEGGLGACRGSLNLALVIGLTGIFLRSAGGRAGLSAKAGESTSRRSLSGGGAGLRRGGGGRRLAEDCPNPGRMLKS